MSPIVFFRIPDKLVRRGQITPVDRALTGFVLRSNLFFVNFFDFARFDIGDSQIRLFMIARRGNESEF